MLKILVMEDDTAVANLVRNLLEVEGYAPVHATDLESAWAMLLAEDPDAAIIDLWIHGREQGWDLVERIRANEALQILPVLIMTGSTTTEARDHAAKLGAEFLAKPFSPAALVDRLQRAIQRAGRTPGQRTVPVVLLAGDYRIEGNVHVPVDLPRFSDAWESVVRDNREFIPVTDAKVIALTTGKETASTPLLEVRKDQIVAALPRE